MGASSVTGGIAWRHPAPELGGNGEGAIAETSSISDGHAASGQDSGGLLDKLG